MILDGTYTRLQESNRLNWQVPIELSQRNLTQNVQNMLPADPVQIGHSTNIHYYTPLDMQLINSLLGKSVDAPINAFEATKLQKKLADLVSEVNLEINVEGLDIDKLIYVLAMTKYEGENKSKIFATFSLLPLTVTIYFLFLTVKSKEDLDQDGVWNYSVASFFSGCLTAFYLCGFCFILQRKRQHENSIRHAAGEVLSRYATFLQNRARIENIPVAEIPADITHWGEESQKWFEMFQSGV